MDQLVGNKTQGEDISASDNSASKNEADLSSQLRKRDSSPPVKSDSLWNSSRCIVNEYTALLEESPLSPSMRRTEHWSTCVIRNLFGILFDRIDGAEASKSGRAATRVAE